MRGLYFWVKSVLRSKSFLSREFFDAQIDYFWKIKRFLKISVSFFKIRRLFSLLTTFWSYWWCTFQDQCQLFWFRLSLYDDLNATLSITTVFYFTHVFAFLSLSIDFPYIELRSRNVAFLSKIKIKPPLTERYHLNYFSNKRLTISTLQTWYTPSLTITKKST